MRKSKPLVQLPPERATMERPCAVKVVITFQPCEPERLATFTELLRAGKMRVVDGPAGGVGAPWNTNESPPIGVEESRS
ncbi:MAG: hypothetical protein L6Q92_04120 [Phycisphaerae bacterium]|nr:hypothetical protein [Phycisphaerae bacterium]